MRRVRSTEINRRWGELLALVIAGETLEVEHRGRIKARIVPVDEPTSEPLPDPPPMVDAVGPRREAGMGKASVATRQARVDEILRRARGGRSE